MTAYEYRHVVTFEETNLVGNVYYANLIRWQGHCREHFLRDHCPGILDDMRRGLALVTRRCSCEFLRELAAFDEVTVRMRLVEASQNRLTMSFEYLRRAGPGEELVARGEQQVAFLRRVEERMIPTPIPDELVQSLRAYSD
jgi:enediyne biosynthesis thioesterase